MFDTFTLGVAPHFYMNPDGALGILSQEASTFTSKTPHCVYASNILVNSLLTGSSGLSHKKAMN